MGTVPSMTTSEHPLCPTCGLPTNEGLADGATVYECANEACPEFGQAVVERADGDAEPGHAGQVVARADDVAPTDG
jgi:hypothetical protein